MTRLDLTGPATRPAQVWGGIRLVPLVREEPMDGLRPHREIYDGFGEVQVDPGTQYVSYIPHGFVADWSGDGRQGTSPGGQGAAYGTQLGEGRPRTVPVHRRHRMVKRAKAGKKLSRAAAATCCRFLPLHLALEGYLALHFGGPSTAWDE